MAQSLCQNSVDFWHRLAAFFWTQLAARMICISLDESKTNPQFWRRWSFTFCHVVRALIWFLLMFALCTPKRPFEWHFATGPIHPFEPSASHHTSTIALTQNRLIWLIEVLGNGHPPQLCRSYVDNSLLFDSLKHESLTLLGHSSPGF